MRARALGRGAVECAVESGSGSCSTPFALGDGAGGEALLSFTTSGDGSVVALGSSLARWQGFVRLSGGSGVDRG